VREKIGTPAIASAKAIFKKFHRVVAFRGCAQHKGARDLIASPVLARL